jgi:hypothetical protein
MFLREIFNKFPWGRLYCAWFVCEGPWRTGLDQWLAQMFLSAMRAGDGILYIVSLRKAHGGSSRSVACLKRARLERSLRAEGEKGGP